MKAILVCVLFALLFLSHAPAHAEVCPGFDSALRVGIRARVTTDSLRVRAAPGLDAEILRQLRRGTRVRIISEAQCVDNLTWWQIESDAGTGYSAEVNPQGERLMGRLGGVDPASLNGQVNGAGGDSRINSACQFGAFDGENDHFFYLADPSSVEFEALHAGDFLRFTPAMLQSGTVAAFPLEYCTGGSIFRAEARRGGQVLAWERHTDTGFESARPPAEFFAQPGQWQVTVNNDTVTVEIPQFTQPTYTLLCCADIFGRVTLLLAGFRPFEQVIYLNSIDQDGNGVMSSSEAAVFELSANDRGAFVGEVEAPFGISGFMVFVGSQGSRVARALADDQAVRRLMDVIAAAFDGGGASGGGSAPPTTVPPPTAVVRVCPAYGTVTLNFIPNRTRNLSVQSVNLRGDDVLAVQIRLCELGYDPGPLDGIYGPITAGAVRAFQTVNRLAVDGIVGPITWGQLFSGAAVRAP